MASFSAFGGDLPYITLIVLHSLEGSVLCLHELSPCVSLMFLCSGDLVVHLLQGGRGVITGSEIVSCCHLFQYFLWNGSVLIWCRPEGICSAFRMMVCDIFFPFFDSLLEAVFCSVYSLAP